MLRDIVSGKRVDAAAADDYDADDDGFDDEDLVACGCFKQKERD